MQLLKRSTFWIVARLSFLEKRWSIFAFDSSAEFWKESSLAAPSPLNLQQEDSPRGKKMECCDDVGPGSHSWGFCSCLSTAEHRPAPQSPVLQDVERSEKKMFRDPVFYKIVQHSLKGRSGGQAVAVWSHLPRPKMSINFELRKSVVHLKKVPWIVTTSFVIDHYVFWCASIMLAAHQDINIS